MRNIREEDQWEWLTNKIFVPIGIGFLLLMVIVLTTAMPGLLFIPVLIVILWAIGKTILLIKGFISERFFTNKEK